MRNHLDSYFLAALSALKGPCANVYLCLWTGWADFDLLRYIMLHNFFIFFSKTSIFFHTNIRQNGLFRNRDPKGDLRIDVGWSNFVIYKSMNINPYGWYEQKKRPQNHKPYPNFERATSPELVASWRAQRRRKISILIRR